MKAIQSSSRYATEADLGQVGKKYALTMEMITYKNMQLLDDSSKMRTESSW